MTNLDITCSLFDFLDAGLHSPKMGWIWKSFLWMLLLHCCCHFVWRNLLIVGFRSVYGILDLLGVRSKADLAAESALLFTLTPMWLRVQHIIISFLFDIESTLINSLMIRGFWVFLFLNDSKTESESENIIHFLRLLFEMMLRARSIAWASADIGNGYRKRMIEIWQECASFQTTSQRLVDKVRTMIKKGWFSDLEILELH